MKININSNALVVYTNKLEKIGGTVLPRAIAKALNETALDVKRNTMPSTARDAFTVRKSNFFKANSRVEFAKQGKIDSMQSRVGFVSLKGSNYAIEDLEQQEFGGNIKKKSFIPMTTARGGSGTKPVRPQNALRNIKNITNAKNSKGKTAAQRLRKAAIHAGPKGIVLSESGTLFRVNSVSRARFKMTPIYSYQKGRSVNVRGVGFMHKAATLSQQKMDEYFITAANRYL